MKNSRDLIFGEVVYIFIIYHTIISFIGDFIYWMITIFRFDHMTGENDQLMKDTFTAKYVFIGSSTTGHPSVI